MDIVLSNDRRVEVSQEEVEKFITHVLIPNPYWRHSGLIRQETMEKYLKGESTPTELVKVARYILIYIENLSFTAYLFDKSENKPDQTKEFNMPVIEKLRNIHKGMNKNHQTLEELAGDVHEMENACMEIGSDPL